MLLQLVLDLQLKEKYVIAHLKQVCKINYISMILCHQHAYDRPIFMLLRDGRYIRGGAFCPVCDCMILGVRG